MIANRSEMAKLTLRKIDRERANQLREICRLKFPIQFKWLGRKWEAEIRPIGITRNNLSDFDIDWGGANAKFRCDSGWLEKITEFVFGAYNKELLNGQWRVALVEAVHSQISENIERLTRKRFLIKEFNGDDDQFHWHKFEIVLACEEAKSFCEIWLDEMGVGFLAAAIRGCQPLKVDWTIWKDIPISAKFVVGATKIPIKHIRELELRDIILLDQSEVGKSLDGIFIEFGGRYFCSATISDKKITICSKIGRCMEEVDGNTNYIEKLQSFDDLSITLNFDLGERFIRLSELAQIGPGYVFDLGRDLSRSVMIRANGKIIGEGELVDIEGRVGVSVLQIAHISDHYSD